MARKFFVGGNWKCNGTVQSVKALVETLNGGKEVPGKDVLEVVVAPTAVHIPAVQASLREDFEVAAQNCWTKGSGAYTGELSADLLADLGLKWVILGHSERRTLCGETNEVVAEKTAYALSKGLRVILCIGETLEQREGNQTGSILAAQLQAVAEKVASWEGVVIAYEPVWAIGTGKVATLEQAQDTHAEARAWLAANVSSATAAAVRILYGGSVSASNCQELAGAPDIDGFLVGGASLKPDFLKILASASAKA